MLPVAILAGGLATRMGDLTKKTPKALLDVGGEPFINHQLHLLRRNGIEDVVICAGFLAEQIQAHVGDGQAFGVRVRYSVDWPELLGTGGALKKALPLLGERFMVLYGDSYLPVKYGEIADAFLASEKPALMTVFKNEGQYDVSNVVFVNNGIELYDKRHATPEMRFIDYGLGCLTAKALAEWPENTFDLADIYTTLSRSGELAGYEVHTRFYEIGSPSGLSELDGMFEISKLDNINGGGYPNPEGGKEVAWNGRAFITDKGACRVLRYTMPNMPSGWSDALTDFHTEATQGIHPIDWASQETAMRHCRSFVSGAGNNGGVDILEIGCSSGTMLRRLRRELPEANVCGADIIGDTLQRLSDELTAEGIPTPLLQFDLTTCPLPGGRYDIVIALNVLEHVEEHENAVSEIARILKPGGVFIFEVPVGAGLYDDYDREMGHYRRYSEGEMLRILSGAGLSKKSLSHLGVFMYPAFWLVKKLRSKTRKREEEKAETPSAMSRTMIQGSGNFVFSLLFKLELWLGGFVSWPFGIRCIGVFSKSKSS